MAKKTAKFCTNCGTQLKDGDKVCGQCGTPVPGATEKEKKKKGGFVSVLKLIVAIVIIAAIAVAALYLTGALGGYKSTVGKMVKALQNYDVEDMEKLTGSVSEETYSARYNDVHEYYKEAISDALDRYEDNVGAVKKISYEITDASEFSKRRVEQAKEILVDDYNMDVSQIKKIVSVELQLNVKGAKDTATYMIDNLYLIKEGGKWTIYYGNLRY